jgi:hypothetical protein
MNSSFLAVGCLGFLFIGTCIDRLCPLSVLLPVCLHLFAYSFSPTKNCLDLLLAQQQHYVGKSEAILDALLALLHVSLLLLTRAHFSCCEELEKGKEGVGRICFHSGEE